MPTALIIGASRGIGLEFARQYRQAGWRVLATARGHAAHERLRQLGATTLELDVAAPPSTTALATWLKDQPLDLAVYVAGIMRDADARTPPTRDDFDAIMRTNVLGAMQALPQVAPRIATTRGVFAFMSTGMSLIGSVSASNCWLYRASKAALNMAVAAAQHTWPNATLITLDPGWVRTDMGGPGAPLSAQQSVRDLRAVLAHITPDDRGGFFHRDGRRETHW